MGLHEEAELYFHQRMQSCLYSSRSVEYVEEFKFLKIIILEFETINTFNSIEGISEGLPLRGIERKTDQKLTAANLYFDIFNKLRFTQKLFIFFMSFIIICQLFRNSLSIRCY